MKETYSLERLKLWGAGSEVSSEGNSRMNEIIGWPND
jgi:hypothetical protein